MPTIRWTFALIVFSLTPFVSSLALAEDSEREAAAKHYQAGMAHYRLEEFDAAVSEFEAGFRIRPAPEFLFNIAQAHRLAKRPEKAVAFYQKYLYMSPDASNRGEVEHQIASLKEQIERAQGATKSSRHGYREP